MVEKILHNRYRILSVLGQGAMGIVYQAIDEKSNALVALKALHQHLAADRELSQRFFGEANALSHLDHDNIVKFVEVFESEGRYYIVLEFIDGFTLTQLLSTTGAFAPERAAYVCFHVADALAYAHSRRIIHRDIKSSNIMQTRTNVIKLTDFGIAREAGKQTAYTAAGTIIGTAEYMSPEQAQGKNIDHRSDIYSLGIVLYEMLVGHAPFKADDQLAILYKQVHERPQRPSAFNNRIPRELDRITLKALAKNPAERYASAAEFANDLKRLMTGTGKVSAPTPVPQTPSDKRNRDEGTIVDGAALPASQKAVSPIPKPEIIRDKQKSKPPIPLIAGGVIGVGLLLFAGGFFLVKPSPTPATPTTQNGVPGGSITRPLIVTDVGYVTYTPSTEGKAIQPTHGIQTFTPAPKSAAPTVLVAAASLTPEATPVFEIPSTATIAPEVTDVPTATDEPTNTERPPTSTRIPPTTVAPSPTKSAIPVVRSFDSISPIPLNGCDYGMQGDGWYHITASNKDAACAALFPLEYRNFSFEVTVKRIDGTGTGGGFAQIRFGARGNDRIALSISRTDRVYGVTGQRNGTVKSSLPSTQSNSFNGLDGEQATDRIQLTMQNGTLRIAINGESVKSVPIDDYVPGQIGIGARSSEGQSHVAFQNVVLQELP